MSPVTKNKTEKRNIHLLAASNVVSLSLRVIIGPRSSRCQRIVTESVNGVRTGVMNDISAASWRHQLTHIANLRCCRLARFRGKARSRLTSFVAAKTLYSYRQHRFNEPTVNTTQNCARCWLRCYDDALSSSVTHLASLLTTFRLLGK